VSWQAALGAAAVATAGVLVLLRVLAPGRPSLQAIADRDQDGQVPAGPGPEGGSADRYDQAMRMLGARVLGRLRHNRVPGLLPDRTDAALLGVSVAHHVGEKILAALFGAALGPLSAVLFGATPASTVGAGVVFAAGAYVLIGWRFADQAKQRRREFAEVAAMYLEVVAMARLSGASVTRCLREAAAMSTHRELARIRDVLERCRLAGTPAWEGLEQEADRLRLPEMRTIADIARMGGRDDAEMYRALRARAASMRGSQLARVRESAKRAGVLVSLPVSGLLLVFCVALAYPFMTGLHL